MADTDRIGETLRKRVLQDGIDFLGQEGRVNGILADMFPDLKKERRWIRMAMESGTGRIFCQIASSNNENEKQNLYQKIKSQIEEDGLADAAIVVRSTGKWRLLEKQPVQIDLHMKKENLHQEHTDQMDRVGFRRCQKQVRLIDQEEHWAQQPMPILCL